MKNQKCIIRTERAGVFYGEVAERTGQEAVLKNVRRLWYWDGAATLSELATGGTKKPTRCKFTCYVDEMIVLGVIEIIPATKEAQESIEGVAVWTA